MNRKCLCPPLIAMATLLPVSAPAQQTPSKSPATIDCPCPKEGHWNAQNLEGWMNCTGPVNLKRKLNEVVDKGTIWILDEDCSSLFGEAGNKNDEDILLHRQADCSYSGVVNGEEDGVSMVIDIHWEMQDAGFIKGEMHSEPSLQGMMCEYYRPYELTFEREINEDDYAKLRKKMEKKLAKVRDRQ